MLRSGINVFYDDELVGSLDHLLFDPVGGVLTHFVVREHGRGRRVIVPEDWVEEVYSEAVILNRWEPDRPGVPAGEAERDDAEIYADLTARFQANPALSNVQVQIERGVAHLSGSVPTPADKAAVEAIARSTPGVVDVDNAVVAVNNDLEIRLNS